MEKEFQEAKDHQAERICPGEISKPWKLKETELDDQIRETQVQTREDMAEDSIVDLYGREELLN